MVTILYFLGRISLSCKTKILVRWSCNLFFDTFQVADFNLQHMHFCFLSITVCMEIVTPQHVYSTYMYNSFVKTCTKMWCLRGSTYCSLNTIFSNYKGGLYTLQISIFSEQDEFVEIHTVYAICYFFPVIYTIFKFEKNCFRELCNLVFGLQ